MVICIGMKMDFSQRFSPSDGRREIVVKESDDLRVKYFEVILDGDSKVLENIKAMVQRWLRVNPAGCSVQCVVGKVP